MPKITQLLNAIDAGDSRAADPLLPAVHGELRKLAAAKMAQEKPGQTLQATALVHEAWVRLAGKEEQQEAAGRESPQKAAIVKLRSFTGLANREIADGAGHHPHHRGTFPGLCAFMAASGAKKKPVNWLKVLRCKRRTGE